LGAPEYLQDYSDEGGIVELDVVVEEFQSRRRFQGWAEEK